MVWVPKLFGREKHVAEATKLVPDPRAHHYWDEGGHLMEAYAKTLGLSGDAWDIFFIYGPSAQWHGPLPPKPEFWMHQLPYVSNAPHLDSERFAAEANARLPKSDH